MSCFTSLVVSDGDCGYISSLWPEQQLSYINFWCVDGDFGFMIAIWREILDAPRADLAAPRPGPASGWPGPASGWPGPASGWPGPATRLPGHVHLTLSPRSIAPRSSPFVSRLVFHATFGLPLIRNRKMPQALSKSVQLLRFSWHNQRTPRGE